MEGGRWKVEGGGFLILHFPFFIFHFSFFIFDLESVVTLEYQMTMTNDK
jgi:hypothetical protein